MLRLFGEVQTYAWGKVGRDSTVAQLVDAGVDDSSIDNKTPYAELWMGTHAKAPSSVVVDGTTVPLSQHLQVHQELMGTAKSEDGQLPFLLKVLSIRKMLSIQAHPDKVLAETLHQRDPINYRDSNHKPELCIALTQFEGLCGFRPLEEVLGHINKYEEFAAVLGADIVKSFKQEMTTAGVNGQERLRDVLAGLIGADEELVSSQLTLLSNRLSQCGSDELTTVEECFLRIHTQYPGDVGCFCLFLLNIMKLLPGQSLFLGPNIPHAYISGDCVECMACSDNVVRAGCTKKFKDASTLLTMLKYDPKPPKEQLFEPEIDGHMKTFAPPVKDFKVQAIELSSGEQQDLPPESTPRILLVTSGSGVISLNDKEVRVSVGCSFFVASQQHLAFSTQDEQLQCFVASTSTVQ
eukprot:m.71177 g.71177  ORF g.71177 m.71177 type:complete len:408 (+) comp11699_c0_seq1:103-1326(+)